MDESWPSRITIEPGKRGGRPCIRGMRITVHDVFSYLASGMTVDEVLRDLPYLAREDVQACFAFAADMLRLPSESPCLDRDYAAQRETLVGQTTLEQIIAEIKATARS